MNKDAMMQITELSMRLTPEDQGRARFYMNEFTWTQVKVSTMTYINRPRPELRMVLGTPVHIDNTLPNGRVEMLIGTPHEHRQRIEYAAARERDAARNLPMTWRERVRSWIRKLR